VVLDGDRAKSEAAGGWVSADGRDIGRVRVNGQDDDLATIEPVFVCPAGQIADDLAEMAGASRRVAVSEPPPDRSVQSDMEARPAGTWPAGLAGTRGDCC
jgi:hypothetical protein